MIRLKVLKRGSEDTYVDVDLKAGEILEIRLVEDKLDEDDAKALLVRHANNLGFKDGVVINYNGVCGWDENRTLFNGESGYLYDYDKDILYFGGGHTAVYEKGKWAKVFETINIDGKNCWWIDFNNFMLGQHVVNYDKLNDLNSVRDEFAVESFIVYGMLVKRGDLAKILLCRPAEK